MSGLRDPRKLNLDKLLGLEEESWKNKNQARKYGFVGCLKK